MKILNVFFCASLFVIAGCANRPETIHASFVSYEKFSHLDCASLSLEMNNTKSELDKYCKLQNSKANGDAVGVFLLGIPFSKLSGDYEGEIARLKGQVEAIETAQIKNECNKTTDNSTFQSTEDSITQKPTSE
jgi:hypothetical protein